MTQKSSIITITLTLLAVSFMYLLPANAAKAKNNVTTAPKPKKIVVFPFQGTNIERGVLNASTAVLKDSMVQNRFIVANWKLALPEAPPAPKPPEAPKPPTPKALPKCQTEFCVTDIAPSRGNSHGGETVVLSGSGFKAEKGIRISMGGIPAANVVIQNENQIRFETPPNNRDDLVSIKITIDNDTVIIYDQVFTYVKPSVLQPQTRALQTQPSHQALTDRQKLEMVKKLNCDYYLEGTMVKLGNKTYVSISIKNSAGETVDNRRMEAASENDLNIIFARIAKAFAHNISVEETRTLDNATSKETSNVRNEVRLQSNHGITLGGGAVLGEQRNLAAMTLGYQGVWVYDDFRAALETGLVFTDTNNRVRSALYMDIMATGFLTHTPISPYVGGGGGVFLGTRIRNDRDDDDTESVWSDDSETSALGFEAFPTAGVEFLRHARMRLHAEFRYYFIIDLSGNFAHGPGLNVGVNW